MARKKRDVDPQAELRRERARIAKDKWEMPFLKLFESRHPDLPVPTRDYKFAEPVGRKFKLDFAFIGDRIGVELDGGGARSRHATVKGYASDCDKMNIAAAMHWRILRFNVIHLKRMADVVDFVADVLRSA